MPPAARSASSFRPSIIFIVYGSLAEVSIGKLFLAGVVPGLALSALYSFYIAVRCLVDPSLAPREGRVGVGERVRAALGLWQMGLLIVVVLGGIYGGIASPDRGGGARREPCDPDLA